VGQDERENRSVARTLDLGWQVLSMLPRSELTRVSEELLDRHYHPDQTADAREAQREDDGPSDRDAPRERVVADERGGSNA
jgi:hypothetical protein